MTKYWNVENLFIVGTVVTIIIAVVAILSKVCKKSD